MADKKKEYEPKLYNPLHDRKLEDLFEDYRKLHTEETNEEIQKERGHDRDALYNTVLGHLRLHKDNEKEFKRYGYKDLKDQDKKKHIEDLVSHLALHGISKQFGKEAAAAYAKNHQLLKDYVERMMATDELRDFDAIVEHLGSLGNIKDSFYDDEKFARLVSQYTINLNKTVRDRAEVKRHITKPEHFGKAADYLDKLLKPHKKRANRGHGDVRRLVDEIPRLASEDYKPRKGKWVEDLPEKK